MGEALRPSRRHLLDLAKSAALTGTAGEQALSSVERAVEGFGKTAKEVGVTAATLKRVQRRLDEVRREWEK